ncbi:hypothetical protein ACMHYB_13620 [Sorangium sp. So ce1128]
MSSIRYGTSFLMLVAAAMAGCAVESADMSDGDMDADVEVVDSSDAALERADIPGMSGAMAGGGESLGAAAYGGGGTQEFGGGGTQAYGGGGTVQIGQCPPVKKGFPPSKFCPPPSKFCPPPHKFVPPPSKFCPSQYSPPPITQFPPHPGPQH